MKKNKKEDDLCCFVCGNPVSEFNKYCTKCGNKLKFIRDTNNKVMVELPKEIECNNCGSIISSANQFCTECGIPIDKKHIRIVNPNSNYNTDSSNIGFNLNYMKKTFAKKFLLIIGALIGSIFLIGLLFQLLDPLKFEIYRWDSSLISIKSNEDKVVELTKVEINGEYVMMNFPDTLDYDPYSPNNTLGLGKKYIKPNDEIELFTKNFYNKNGVLFDSQKMIVTKVSVFVKIGKGLFNTRVYAGYWK